MINKKLNYHEPSENKILCGGSYFSCPISRRGKRYAALLTINLEQSEGTFFVDSVATLRLYNYDQSETTKAYFDAIGNESNEQLPTADSAGNKVQKLFSFMKKPNLNFPYDAPEPIYENKNIPTIITTKAGSNLNVLKMTEEEFFQNIKDIYRIYFKIFESSQEAKDLELELENTEWDGELEESVIPDMDACLNINNNEDSSSKKNKGNFTEESEQLIIGAIKKNTNPINNETELTGKDTSATTPLKPAKTSNDNLNDNLADNNNADDNDVPDDNDIPDNNNDDDNNNNGKEELPDDTCEDQESYDDYEDYEDHSV